MTIIKRIIRKITRVGLTRLDRFRYTSDHSFVIIANNCWGGEIYKYLNRPFNTPFIGLYIYPECYVRLLNDFERYMRSELVFSPGNISRYSDQPFEYSVGILGGDVEIFFMHYASEQEAYEKWTRRTQRMLEETRRDRYFIKLCDRLGGTPKIMQAFHALPYPNKISFTSYPFEHPQNVPLRASDQDHGEAPTGVALFWVTHYYLDLIYWLKSGHIGSSFMHQLYRHFVV